MKPQGFPKTVFLKNNAKALLRLQEPNDALALHAFYKALPDEDHMFLDDDVTSPDWIVRFMARSDFERIIPIVAFDGDRIVGHAWLVRSKHGWMTRVGQMRLVVARDHQRMGIGSALARELLAIASNFGLEKMTVRMMDNQTAAIRAFERIGFRTEAVLRGYVTDTRGRRRNLVLMGNDIAQIWQAMEHLVSDMPPSREALGG